MERYFVDLDISKNETAICVRREDGGVVRSGKVPTEPEEICAALQGLVKAWSALS